MDENSLPRRFRFSRDPHARPVELGVQSLVVIGDEKNQLLLGGSRDLDEKRMVAGERNSQGQLLRFRLGLPLPSASFHLDVLPRAHLGLPFHSSISLATLQTKFLSREANCSNVCFLFSISDLLIFLGDLMSCSFPRGVSSVERSGGGTISSSGEEVEVEKEVDGERGGATRGNEEEAASAASSDDEEAAGRGKTVQKFAIY